MSYYLAEANKDILEFNFFGVNKQWMKGRLLILLGLALFFKDNLSPSSPSSYFSFSFNS